MALSLRHDPFPQLMSLASQNVGAGDGDIDGLSRVDGVSGVIVADGVTGVIGEVGVGEGSIVVRATGVGENIMVLVSTSIR